MIYVLSEFKISIDRSHHVWFCDILSDHSLFRFEMSQRKQQAWASAISESELNSSDFSWTKMLTKLKYTKIESISFFNKSWFLINFVKNN